MSLSVGVSGTWKTVAQLSVGVGGAWKTVTAGWVGVAGVWKQFYAALDLIGGYAYAQSTSPADATATYALTNTGLEQRTGLSDNTWLLSGSASDYDVRATLLTGTLTSGTTGSWLSLGTTRSWVRTRTLNIPGTDVVTLTIDLSLAGAATIIATASVTIEAEVT
jgi:hypothetical protein